MPKGAGHRKKSLSGMVLLHEYSGGEGLLVTHGESAANGPHVACGIAVQVYHDPPMAKVAVKWSNGKGRQEDMLRHSVNPTGNDWDEHLDCAVSKSSKPLHGQM